MKKKQIQLAWMTHIYFFSICVHLQLFNGYCSAGLNIMYKTHHLAKYRSIHIHDSWRMSTRQKGRWIMNSKKKQIGKHRKINWFNRCSVPSIKSGKAPFDCKMLLLYRQWYICWSVIQDHGFYKEKTFIYRCMRYQNNHFL